jgi:hypothetical protein
MPLHSFLGRPRRRRPRLLARRNLPSPSHSASQTTRPRRLGHVNSPPRLLNPQQIRATPNAPLASHYHSHHGRRSAFAPPQRPESPICPILATHAMEYSVPVDSGAVLRVPALSFAEGPAASIVEGADLPAFSSLDIQDGLIEEACCASPDFPPFRRRNIPDGLMEGDGFPTTHSPNGIIPRHLIE